MSLILELLGVLLLYPPSQSESRGIIRVNNWLLGVGALTLAALLAWALGG